MELGLPPEEFYANFFKSQAEEKAAQEPGVEEML